TGRDRRSAVNAESVPCSKVSARVGKGSWPCQNARACGTHRMTFFSQHQCRCERLQDDTETAAPVEHDSPPRTPFRSFHTTRVRSCRSTTMDKIATLLPLYPHQRTHPRTRRRMALCANFCREHVQQKARKKWPRTYSISSSARASKAGGMMTPSAFAVLRLMTRKKRIGCSTGKSAGFAPLKILSTKRAARRKKSLPFSP